MALEHLFNKDGLKENTGDIVVPKTTLEKLEMYQFAYAANIAMQGDNINVAKSGLELAMEGMGLVARHNMPNVYSSFANADAIKNTAELYSGYWQEAYEKAKVGDLMSLFDKFGIIKDNVARVKMEEYKDMTLKELDEVAGVNKKAHEEERGKEMKDVDRKKIHYSNKEIILAGEVAQFITGFRNMYLRTLVEIARTRSNEEYFGSMKKRIKSIADGPDMKDLGHHL
ncbi:hypothetical protein HY449_04635 [Candidatus Pacearchaeota archaeon]|nr:hypothetical protein [Candidatus Pacearchaeota archaeon]